MKDIESLKEKGVDWMRSHWQERFLDGDGYDVLKEIEVYLGGTYHCITEKSSEHSKKSRGCDRFYRKKGYARQYSENIQRFIGRSPIVCEVGILRGTGLVIWDFLFSEPKTQLIGLDIEIENALGAFTNLKNNYGAYPGVKNWDSINQNSEKEIGDSKLTLLEFNQLKAVEENKKFMKTILGDRKIDICIDDGCHTEEANTKTLEVMIPHLSEDFVYFIEDISMTWLKPFKEKIEKEHPNFNITNDHPNMLVITRR